VIRSSLKDWQSMKKECIHARHRFIEWALFRPDPSRWTVPLNATRRGKEIENTCELLRWQRWAGKNRIRGFLRTDSFPELIDIAFAGFPTKLLEDFLWREIRITSLYSNCNLTNQRMCVCGCVCSSRNSRMTALQSADEAWRTERAKSTLVSCSKSILPFYL
jgi:hypothetical protein